MAEPLRATREILNKLDELPTLPSIVYELSQIIQDPMSSTRDIEKVMTNDQSLTTKVLKLVNSAYYAIPGGVSSLSRAIAYIGYDTVHQLVLSASIIKALQTNGPSKFDMNEFWKHSIGVAIGSETIAQHIGHRLPADLFTCGLVHDMGKVAIYTIEPETLLKVSQLAIERDISYFDAEREMNVPTHTFIGKALAEKWRLPLQMQAVIERHHQKDVKLRGGLSSEISQAVDIVYLANLIVHAFKFGNSGHHKILGAPTEVMERLMISPSTGFRAVASDIKNNLNKAAEFIRVIGS